MSSIEKWYALYTQPRAEKKVKRELDLREQISYLPLQTTLKQWSDRKKKVEIPLFNSYIFIKTNLEKNYYEILNIPGIVKFVSMGKDIVTMREEQIDQIRLFLAEFDSIKTVDNQNLKLNQHVRIIAGPLKGTIGLLTEYKGQKHFGIEIPELGTNLLVTIPLQYLSPLD